MYHPSSRVFMMTNKTSSFFRRAGSILHEPLMVVYTQNSSIFYIEQCTTPSSFHNFEVSPGACNHSLKSYGFQFGTPFSSIAHTHVYLHIASQQKIITQDRWIRTYTAVCSVHGMGSKSQCIHPEKGWPGVWMDAWVSDSSANTASVAI